ncbi:DUF6174 domain-containing protein [Streptomyces europaeiscabiei]|uniref:DUF6174 domain-containing protein n=1 Tax=Streptomyces europaeiscabiei TaxID=146819 RepID=UPI0029B65FA0|nr:DUF6174 domain-containing protein [Streptomyces europaeiscabiei]MDX3581225.1 DUF6174 domain-containing protein [Streptomyces europaeiscabiei]MDX3632618.1 DUF6174 domain-containing protein [Streptomyces europaeiscabiei]MDX3653108.1 DUF6174 domain-containing protein [Streptomyces europaeiscabiei]
MPTPATARVRHRALSAAATAGALIWALSACGEESTTVKGAAPAWEEPSAYRYTLKSSEGERALIGTFEVTVRDGKVVKTVGVDESGRRVVDQEPTEVPTIAELLKQAETARAEDADDVDVDYAKDGRPVSISIDWEENAIDDEEAYTLGDYEALG